MSKTVTLILVTELSEATMTFGPLLFVTSSHRQHLCDLLISSTHLILVSVNTTSSESTISSTGKPTEICKSSSDEKSLTITLESKITPVWILKFTFFEIFIFWSKSQIFRWSSLVKIFVVINSWFRGNVVCSRKISCRFRYRNLISIRLNLFDQVQSRFSAVHNL